MTLPAGNLCTDEFVSGVLISEVLHVLRPGQPLSILRDALRWLEPGCLLVSTSASAVNASFVTHVPDLEVLNGRSMEDIEAPQKRKCTDKELIESATAFAQLKRDSEFCAFHCGNLYPMTTRRLGALARLSGFEILRLEYISPRKYPDLPESLTGETVLLAARKPSTN